MDRRVRSDALESTLGEVVERLERLEAVEHK